jgi:hypothetical protein
MSKINLHDYEDQREYYGVRERMEAEKQKLKYEMEMRRIQAQQQSQYANAAAQNAQSGYGLAGQQYNNGAGQMGGSIGSYQTFPTGQPAAIPGGYPVSPTSWRDGDAIITCILIGANPFTNNDQAVRYYDAVDEVPKKWLEEVMMLDAAAAAGNVGDVFKLKGFGSVRIMSDGARCYRLYT